MSTNGLSDSEIVRRVQEGDCEAYRLLVDRYASMVFRALRPFCRNPTDTEDLAQDVFLRAYEGLEDFRGEAQFSSWLYQIALNRGRDHAKSARVSRRASTEMEEVLEQLSTEGSTSPQHHLEEAERAEQLREAIRQLPPDYATAFTMKYEMGLRYKDMAIRLDDTVGALKVRVHRARKKLRSILEDWT